MIDDKKSTDPFEAMDAEFKRLRDENARLRAMLGIPDSGVASRPEASTPDLRKSGGDLTPTGKIALFRSLFRGREDVYAVRWEGKDAMWSGSVLPQPQKGSQIFTARTQGNPQTHRFH